MYLEFNINNRESQVINKINMELLKIIFDIEIGAIGYSFFNSTNKQISNKLKRNIAGENGGVVAQLLRGIP